MPQQIYPGQSKFHSQNEEAKSVKQRANARLRMAKLRQIQSKQQVAKTNLLQTQWRQKQKQQQQNDNEANEKLMSQLAIERYVIGYSFYF